jgi:hypothetical protein
MASRLFGLAPGSVEPAAAWWQPATISIALLCCTALILVEWRLGVRAKGSKRTTKRRIV